MNNAGVALMHYSETVQGHEKVFGTNYLAPVLLTRLLMLKMKKTG